AGFLTRTGPPGQLTRHVVRSGQPVFSAQTFEELEQRLWRPRFDRYVSLEQRKELLADIESIASWVVVSPEIAARTFCRDPTDDKFIHAALAAGPAWLVTGDKDLLVLADSLSALGVRILAPAAALGMCQTDPSTSSGRTVSR
ncbi:putative toxin-antitoxin system toxin component, PIN family, partial [Immundisolibacter sp.]|uniref:putative toxin-antitoxin system toxin component, PIN family n=1 Tax=Immundisolibacter sp. TaxID=1934948 RepID=UPI003565D1BF